MTRIYTLIALLVVSTFSITFAQSAFDALRIQQNELGFGTRALAMGGAYTGLADDYSAIYWNPAGLANVRYSHATGEMSYRGFNNNATFSGQLTENNESYIRPGALGFVMPLPVRRGSFVLAFGYNRVNDYDQQLEFSGFSSESNGLTFNVDGEDFLFDRNVSQSESITDKGGMAQYNVGAGMALSPNFNAGVTATIWDGEDDYRFIFNQEDTENNFSGFPADFDRYELDRTLLTDYRAFSLKFGGMFDLDNGLRIGASVGLPTTFTVEEIFTSNDNLIFDNGDDDPLNFPAAGFEYKVTTPYHLDAGASLQGDLFTLSGSVRYRDWSQLEFKIADSDIDDPDFQALRDENRVIADSYQSTLDYHLGAEVCVEAIDATLRGGFAFMPSPVKDEFAANANLDKQYFSGGINFKVDRYVNLDITYVRGQWEQLTEDEFTPGGTLEEITTNRIMAGLTYRFR